MAVEWLDFKKNGLGHRKVTWRHTKVKVRNIEGAPKVLLCSKYGAIPTIISGVTAFWIKISLIGRHLETVGRTEPVFELILAPSEKRPTNECQSDSGNFLSYCVNITSCNLCARATVPGHRAKNRTEPFPGKIGRGILNLVALTLTGPHGDGLLVAGLFFTDDPPCWEIQKIDPPCWGPGVMCNLSPVF